VLSGQVQAAVATVTFDEQPRLLTFINDCAPQACSPNLTCTERQCDYANTQTCGRPLLEGCSCSVAAEYCGGDWILLTSETSQVHTLETSEVLFFRFLVEDSCSAVRITVIPDYGNPDLLISRDLDDLTTGWPLNTRWWSWTQTGEAMTLCPSHPEFSIGTFFVSVTASLATRFTIALTVLGTLRPHSSRFHNHSLQIPRTPTTVPWIVHNPMIRACLKESLSCQWV